jgi:hypothetical protein
MVAGQALHAHRSVRVGRGNAARRHLLLRRTHDTRAVTAAANLAESQYRDQRRNCERAAGMLGRLRLMEATAELAHGAQILASCCRRLPRSFQR